MQWHLKDNDQGGDGKVVKLMDKAQSFLKGVVDLAQILHRIIISSL
jgi:hypothetical protein